MVCIDPETHNLFVKVIEADLVEDLEKGRVLWEKQDLLRHDPDKLANTICRVYARLPVFPI
jgi:hypothetical protein